MGITVSWYDPDKTVILRKTEGEWTWEEFEASFDEAYSLIQSVGFTVHMISDNRSAAVPPDGSVFSHVQHVWSKRPQNVGMTISVGADPVLKQVAGAFVKTFSTEEVVRFVATMDGAEAELAKLRGG